MRFLQKIVRNGNASQVTLPKQLLAWTDLIPGQPVIIEALEDKSIRIRAVGSDELAPRRPAHIVLDGAPPVTP